MSTLVRSLRAMRDDLRRQEAPPGDAPANEQGWYILGQFVAVGLSGWFWVGVVLVAAMVTIVEHLW